MKPKPKSQKRAMLSFAAIVTVMLAALIWNFTKPVPEYRWNGIFLGQPYTLIVQDRAVTPGVKELMNGNLKDLLVQLETRFSRTPGIGLVAEFNASTSTVPLYVGTELWRVVNLEKRFSQVTPAADITTAQLKDIWTRVRTGQIPPLTPTAASDLMRDTGMDRIAAPAEGYIRKLRANTVIAVESTAQGYAADSLENFMIANKIARFHIQIGGTILNRNMPAYTSPLPINYGFGINPTVTNRIMLGTGQIVTRGIGDGFIHVDPRTGMPPTNRVHSVSVIAESAMISSCLATILLYLGPEEGIRWIEGNGIARGRALFIMNDPAKGLIPLPSRGFPLEAEKKP